MLIVKLLFSVLLYYMFKEKNTKKRTSTFRLRAIFSRKHGVDTLLVCLLNDETKSMYINSVSIEVHRRHQRYIW